MKYKRLVLMPLLVDPPGMFGDTELNSGRYSEDAKAGLYSTKQ